MMTYDAYKTATPPEYEEQGCGYCTGSRSTPCSAACERAMGRHIAECNGSCGDEHCPVPWRGSQVARTVGS